MPTEPNLLHANGKTPVVVLAAKAWPLPPLAVKQHRHVDPAVFKLLPWWWEMLKKTVGQPAVEDLPGDATPEQQEERAAKLAKRAEMITAIMAEMDSARYDLMLDCIYWSLTRAHPTLTRAEFDEMEITTRELIAAFPVVLQQSGMFERKEAVSAPGEAMAQPTVN